MNQLHFTPDVGRRGKLHHKVNHITHYSLLADPFQLPSRRLRDIWRIVAPALMPFWLAPRCFCLDLINMKFYLLGKRVILIFRG